MDFSQQPNSSRNAIGLSAVLLLHLVFGYALLNGLGRKVVEVLSKPVEVNLIEEQKPVPPPPLKKIEPLPPRNSEPPPPAYVPPAEVQVQSPVQQNSIAVTSHTPQPTVDTVSKPAAPAVTPPKPVAPAVVAVGIVCPNHLDVRSQVPYPPQAERLGLSGDVVVEFTVTASGQVANIAVTQSSHPSFNTAATKAVTQLRCNAKGQDVRVRIPFSFRLER